MAVRLAVFGFLFLTTLAFGAVAGSYDPRVSELENEVRQLRQAISSSGSGSGGSVGSAALSVKLTEIEEQMRTLRGMVEQVQHRQMRLESEQKSLGEDIDFRLRAIEERAGMGAAPAGAAPTPDAGANATAAPVAPAPTSQDLSQAQPAPDASSDTSAIASYASPKEHYDQAFKLMNQAKYAEAGATLEAFTKRYPKDPLIGNVYYWLGETYYVRENYLKAVDNFRQGFEAAPDGLKAPDNLFKLALSLNMLQKKREACVVLKQLQIKYQGQNTPVLQKAKIKEKELQCS